jgi:hypothetical protein
VIKSVDDDQYESDLQDEYDRAYGRAVDQELGREDDGQ